MHEEGVAVLVFHRKNIHIFTFGTSIASVSCFSSRGLLALPCRGKPLEALPREFCVNKNTGNVNVDKRDLK